MLKSKWGWGLAGILVGAVLGVTTIMASQDDRDIPVSAEGILVESAWNTDWQIPGAARTRGQLEKAIEGSVSFKVDVALAKIRKHMQEPGTWGKISANVSDYNATKVVDNEAEAVYKIEQTLNPSRFQTVNAMAATKVNLVVTINKRAAREDAIAVRWNLDPEKPSAWKRFSGRIYGVDLHTGKTMVLVTTSTQSGYAGLPDRVRLKLAEHYLAKTKDNIVGWLRSLN
jgi:hypothetical protein